NRSYWALDRHFNVIAGEDGEAVIEEESVDDFQPMDESEVHGTKPRVFPKNFSLLASPLALTDPIAIEALPDGTVLILDFDPLERFSKIFRYRFSKQLGDEISTEVILKLIEEPAQNDFSLVGYDMAFVPEHLELGEVVQDRLYVVAADGNQGYAFRLCLRADKVELQPVAEYLPMRLFGGKALAGTKNGAFYDFAENWIPLIQQRRPRYVAEATFETPLKTALNKPYFDGGEPDCVWHRIMLDAHIPPETTIEIWSRAANEEIDLPRLPWQREPTPYLRGDGSELPFLRASQPVACAGVQKLKTGAGTWELLFQRARGRFLQLRIRLKGDERTTPRLRALRAYYPRFSYLANYLPSVYREDPQSASFLDRFLSNVEGMYTTLEDKIAAMQILFDVRSAPAEVLDWLAGWFGVALDPSWDEARRRMFIAHAIDFFQYRGTIRGLTMALHLALDECADENIFKACCTANQREPIRIVERYLTRTLPGVIFGDPSEATGPRAGALTSSWVPAQGRANLNQRYAEVVGQTPGAAVVEFPLIAPTNEADSEKWRQFSQTTIGFIPSTAATEHAAWQSFLQGRYVSLGSLKLAHQTNYTSFASILAPRDQLKTTQGRRDWEEFVLETNSSSAHLPRRLWQDFLARRYRRIKAMNQLYGTTWTSFELVPLPDALPFDGAPLADWVQFESVVVRMQRAAHRFTVLLPVPLSLAFNPEEHQRRLELSRRIIELEKPAHTVFDVKFYWAMFRIGEARLQFDTVIAQGSRAPQLLPEFVVGEGFVGEGYLGPPVPEDACDRFILGRDPLRITPS
ncbi:MAG TPA: phage tail protein, partial [Pyrinomonadaceae bacterium]|nr:phage tail protein [Pyrinomonadaceae bacterium]